jgi:hypothetical protein
LPTNSSGNAAKHAKMAPLKSAIAKSENAKIPTANELPMQKV